MPVYEYDCHGCGPFTMNRRMADRAMPASCPECGNASRRVIASVPRLATLSSATRHAHATNERSAHRPDSVQGYRARHPAGCSCCSSAKPSSSDPPKVKTRTGPRPWMISH